MKKNNIYIIAEAGVNHNGSLKRALKMIDVASKAGANAIKFQSYLTDELVSKNSKLADYQKKNSQASNQHALLKKYEFSFSEHRVLLQRAKKRKIEFLSTPFDLNSLENLVKLKVKKLKVSSGDLNNYPFLIEIGKSQKEIILSTGMGNIKEIQLAISSILFGKIKKRQPKNIQEFSKFHNKQKKYDLSFLTILHCTSLYPCPIENVNLRFMTQLKNLTGCEVGFSDHTAGIDAPIIASSIGAKIIEKHFTLNKKLKGPDHSASLEPKQLFSMIKKIRDVELIMGKDKKIINKNEKKVSENARKKIIAGSKIQIGERFSYQNIKTIRQKNGLDPIYQWSLVGKKSSRFYEKGKKIIYEK